MHRLFMFVVFKKIVHLSNHPLRSPLVMKPRGFLLHIPYQISRLNLPWIVSLKKLVQLATLLHEREPREISDSSRLGLYISRWVRWTQSGFGDTYGAHGYGGVQSYGPPGTLLMVTVRPSTALRAAAYSSRSH